MHLQPELLTPRVPWSLPLTIHELESRVTKAYSLYPDAEETAEFIAARWLGGEDPVLARVALEALAQRGLLRRRAGKDQRIHYSLNNQGLARSIQQAIRQTASQAAPQAPPPASPDAAR
jgi:hypothetical protein